MALPQLPRAAGLWWARQPILFFYLMQGRMSAAVEEQRRADRYQ